MTRKMAFIATVTSLRRHRRDHKLTRSRSAVDELELPPAVFKTCPWQPRDLVEIGLRQWLRCYAAAYATTSSSGCPHAQSTKRGTG